MQNLEQRKERSQDVKKRGALATKAGLGGQAGRNPSHAEGRVGGSSDEESGERERDQEEREDAKWALFTGCIVLAIYGTPRSSALALCLLPIPSPSPSPSPTVSFSLSLSPPSPSLLTV